MKLTLIILLLTGVAASAQNLRGDHDEMTLLKGSELAVRELGKNEDKEEKGKDKKKDGDDAQLTQPVVAPPPIKVDPLPEQPPCEEGFRLKKGECVPKASREPKPKRCTKGFTLVNGDCECLGNKEVKNGRCVDKKDTKRCTKGFTLVNGDCECLGNKEVKNGRCVDKKDTKRCTKGFTLVNGDCECVGDDKEVKNGRCVDKKDTKRCTKGFTLVNGDCECVGDDKEVKNGRCVDKSSTGDGCTNNDDCDKNERCRKRSKRGSRCVCKYGYTRRNGECKKGNKHHGHDRCDDSSDCDQGEKCRRIGFGYKKRCVDKSWYRRTDHRCFSRGDCGNHGMCRRFRFGRRSCMCDKHFGGRRCNRCAWRWHGHNCGRRRYYRKKYYHRIYDCDTEVKVVAVVTDNEDEEKTECVVSLRSDPDLLDFLEDEFEPEKLQDLDVAEVDLCTNVKLEEELEDLQGDQDLTGSEVKVVFVVVKEDDFARDNNKCEDELDNLQFKLEDLSCSDIEDFEDFITIEVDSSTRCKSDEMKEAVLQENNDLKE